MPSGAPWRPSARRSDRLIAAHLAKQTGAIFRGRIGGVVSAGLFVKLDESGADGFVPVSTLGRDYFVYDKTRHALIGERSGDTYQLGDRLEVKLVEATPVSGGMRFEVVSEAREGKPAAARRAVPGLSKQTPRRARTRRVNRSCGRPSLRRLGAFSTSRSALMFRAHDPFHGT